MQKKAKAKKKKTPRVQAGAGWAEIIRQFDRSPPERFTAQLQPMIEEERNAYERSN